MGSGKVFPYGLSQIKNPADHDTYDTRFSTQEATLKDQNDKHYAKQQWGVQQEEEANAWRGIAHTTTREELGSEIGNGSLAQRRAIPDGYTFNFDNLKDSIKTAHDTTETNRNAAVDAQEAADQWRKGSTPNSGKVFPYGLSQRRAIPDGYTFNFDNLKDSVK